MLDKRKINLMIKLAIYDAKEGIKDKKIFKHYKMDYISKKILFNNIILILFLVLFVVLKFVTYIIESDMMWTKDILSEMTTKYIIMSCVIVFVYSLYNIYIYNKRYNVAQKNLTRYYKAINKLNKMDDIEG